MALRRRSHMAKRLTKMRGLEPNEKQLLIRIGEIVDGVINNRGPTNPFTVGRRPRDDARLPPPAAITNEPGIRTSKLTWPAVDASILSHYEIDIQNLDNGNFERFVSFTNLFIFKGRVGGNYEAKVRSIGRNGTSSPVTTISFFMADNVMLLEGTKNNFNGLGTRISEDIFHTAGHIIFPWVSFTIDRLIGGENTGNNVATASLYRSAQGLDFNVAELIESISLYKATETAADLDTTALGNGIFRPSLSGDALTDPDFIRGTSYETTLATMFSPIPVTSDEENLTWTYWLEITGREAENDITSLSLSLWSANEGLAIQIPSDPNEPEPDVVRGDFKSIELNNTGDATNKNEWLHGTISEPFNRIDDTWSLAFWVKWRKIGVIDTLVGVLFEYWTPDSGGGALKNNIRFTVGRSQASGPFVGNVLTLITVTNADGSIAGTWQARDPNFINPVLDGDFVDFEPFMFSTNAVPGGLGQDSSTDELALWSRGLDDWHFVVLTFNPNAGLKVYINGIQKRTGQNARDFPQINTTAGISQFGGKRAFIWGGTETALYTGDTFNGPTDSVVETVDCNLWQAGMWNRELDLVDVQFLYNNGGDPNSVLYWAENSPPLYFKSGSLRHYWQFGAVNSELKWVARDTGLNPQGSGGEDGDIDLSETGINPPTTQEFSVNFTLDNVIDDFPDGT